MTDINTATSKAFGIPEIRSGILSYLGSQCNAVSRVSRGLYLSCVVDNPSLILKNFLLTDLEISRHDLPTDASWDRMKAAIRSRKFPRVHTLDLSLAPESKVPSGIGVNKLSSKSMIDAFLSSNPAESFAWLRTTFPNLQVMLNVPLEDLHGRRTKTGTLHIPKDDSGVSTLKIDGPSLLGDSGAVPRFPLPNNTELVYDITLPSERHDSIPQYGAAPPFTSSFYFPQPLSPFSERLDELLPTLAHALNAAHKKAHHRSIPKMSFDLKPHPHNRSNSYLKLANSLRRDGLIGPEGFTEMGSYDVCSQVVPLDEDCLTDQILLDALGGLKHWSLAVSQSEASKRHRRHSRRPFFVLPESLRQLSLRYKHKVFPKEEYMSRLAQLVDDIDPEMTLDVRLMCDMPSRCQDDHDGGYGSVLASKRRQFRSERIERTERSNVTAKTDNEIVESAAGKMVSISTHVS